MRAVDRDPIVSQRVTARGVWSAVGCAVLIGTSGCTSPGESAPAEAHVPFAVAIEHAAKLEARPGPILASANSIARDRYGRIYIGDTSDRVVKVFGSDGRQAEPIGSPGPGPGEFTTLASAGVLGDSVLGWDRNANRLSVFSRDGEYARAFPLLEPGGARWSRVRVMDDSLLVTSGWAMGAHDKPLVGVFDRHGTRLGRLMDMSRLLSPPDPEFLQHTWVFADGSDGVVFSTIHGVDTLLAYTPEGRLLAAGNLGLTDHEPVLDIRRLIARNGGTLRRPDGSWAQDEHYGVLNLVALGGGLVAVQFGRLDLRTGTDLLADGGPVLVLRMDPENGFERVRQIQAPGALLGRSGPGEALILRWGGGELEQLDLFRLTVTPE